MRFAGRLVSVIALGLCLGTCAPPPPHDMVLRIANWGGASEENEFERTIRDLMRRFEANHPGLRIKVERIPGSADYMNKMLLSFVAGTEPDIMSLDASSAAVFINNGVLRDLMPFISSDPDFHLTDYYENVVRIDAREEALYAIPGDFTPMVMYYNKRLFDAAGVPYPKPGWTVGEFLQTAKRLTIAGDRAGDPPKQWGFKFANWMPGWIIWLWNFGGDVLSPNGERAEGFLNSPNCIAALEFLRDLIQVHKVAPSLSSTAATGVDIFANGQAAMEVSGHWAMVGYQSAPKIKLEDVGVVELPSNIGKSHTVMYEVGFAIGKNCRNPDAAWELIKFFTSREYQQAYNATGIAVCARKDVSESKRVDPREQAFLDIVPSARAPWGARVEGYAFVETTGVQMMDRILAGENAQVVATEAARRIDRYFKIK